MDDVTGQNNPQESGQSAKPEPLPPGAMVILPVRQVVLFPGIVLPFSIGRPASIAAAQEAVRNELPLGVLLQKDPNIEDPTAEQLYRIGTAAQILRYVTAPDGTHHVICSGTRRIRVLDFVRGYPFLVAKVEEIGTSETLTLDIEARVELVRARAREAIGFLPTAPPEMAAAIEALESPSALADFVAGIIDAKPAEKQDVLETLDVKQRLDKVLVMLVAAHRGAQAIQGDRRADAAIAVLAAARTHPARAASPNPEATWRERRKVREDRGIARSRSKRPACRRRPRSRRARRSSGWNACPRRPPNTAWSAPISNGWSNCHGRSSALIRIDIAEARRILDEDHYGLPKVKRRILEYLAVRKLNPDGKSPILCFVGPPGVGKTSLGQSIARATGRKFARLALGGVHDEAEISGHRRTYIGALPGNIIQSIRKAGTRNPVLMLDEVDKIGAGFHGDPSSALLEVLDPEQNSTFRDNYLGVAFDLSTVMFIATANMLDAIPGPVRDRMEIIEIPGYTEEEKLEIAKRYLLKRQLAATGLIAEQCEITRAAIRDDHSRLHPRGRRAQSRTADRRNLPPCRNADRGGQCDACPRRRDAISTAYSVRRRYENEVAMRTSVPGVATGLAWTPVGGDILFIEATRVPGRNKLILTGQLGEVMKESAQAALTLVKSRSPKRSASTQPYSRNRTSTFMCPPAPFQRMGRALVSPCSWHWPRYSRGAPSRATSR